MISVPLNPFALVLLFVTGMIFGGYISLKLVLVSIRSSSTVATEMMQVLSKAIGIGAWIHFTRHWAIIECPKCGHADALIPGEDRSTRP